MSEPTAIRTFPITVNSTPWHRRSDQRPDRTACSRRTTYMRHEEPLSQVPTADRCKTCWPPTKDVTP